MELRRFCTMIWPCLLVGRIVSALDTAPGFSDDELDQIQARLSESATKSWEIGVQLEALTHLRYPEFAPSYAGTPPNLSKTDVSKIKDVYSIVENIVDAIPEGQMQIMEDEAAGDPNSIIPAMLMAAQMKGSDSEKLMTAVNNQMQATFNNTPRSDDGAISQRTDYVQLWSDFMYMVPPAIGYYGYITNNVTMLEVAFQQSKLYSDALLDGDLWMHIVDGPWQDLSLWATGNAWAINGQMRLLEMAVKSQYADQLASQIDETVKLLDATLNAAWSNRNPITNLLPNWLGYNESNPYPFSDSASTALIAATTYRFASAGYGSSNIQYAEKARAVLQEQLDPNGWLQNVVDPIQWDQLGSKSPEAQAFLMLMQSAWSDWADITKADIKSSSKRRRTRRWNMPRIARET